MAIVDDRYLYRHDGHCAALTSPAFSMAIITQPQAANTVMTIAVLSRLTATAMPIDYTAHDTINELSRQQLTTESADFLRAVENLQIRKPFDIASLLDIVQQRLATRALVSSAASGPLARDACAARCVYGVQLS